MRALQKAARHIGAYIMVRPCPDFSEIALLLAKLRKEPQATKPLQIKFKSIHAAVSATEAKKGMLKKRASKRLVTEINTDILAKLMHQTDIFPSYRIKTNRLDALLVAVAQDILKPPILEKIITEVVLQRFNRGFIKAYRRRILS